MRDGLILYNSAMFGLLYFVVCYVYPKCVRVIANAAIRDGSDEDLERTIRLYRRATRITFFVYLPAILVTLAFTMFWAWVYTW